MPKGVYDRSHLRPCTAEEAEQRRRALARRKALGLPVGRPVVRVLESEVCERCKSPFEYRRGPREHRRRFCSHRCFLGSGQARAKVFLTKEVLRELYWVRNMTTVEIGAQVGIAHRTVIAWMRKLGVPRRPRGASRYASVCFIEGCSRPVHKIKHRTNGASYGRRCFEHWTEYRRSLHGKYTQQKRNARRLTAAGSSAAPTRPRTTPARPRAAAAGSASRARRASPGASDRSRDRRLTRGRRRCARGAVASTRFRGEGSRR